jgi:hypothetical protein
MSITIEEMQKQVHNLARENTMDGRFWNLVEIKGENDCWTWSGSWQKGKGSVFNDAACSAPRYAYFSIYRIWPDKLVCHTCDNDRCMNPKHWFLGTDSDNKFDMMNKFRHPRQRIKVEERIKVHQLIKEGKSINEVALLYKVSPKCIRNIEVRYDFN